LIEVGLGLGKLHPSCEHAISELRQLMSTCQHYELKAARLLSNKSVSVLFFLLIFTAVEFDITKMTVLCMFKHAYQLTTNFQLNLGGCWSP